MREATANQKEVYEGVNALRKTNPEMSVHQALKKVGSTWGTWSEAKRRIEKATKKTAKKKLPKMFQYTVDAPTAQNRNIVFMVVPMGEVATMLKNFGV